MAENLTELLGKRYRATLALVACLALLNQLLVQPALLQLNTDAPVINIAGRQRMLSQRLAKAVLGLERNDHKTRERYLDELDRVLRLWVVSHDGLRLGNGSMSLPGGNSASVNEALNGLEPLFLKMRTAAERLVRGRTHTTPAEPVQADIEIILGAEADYLERMDKVVGLFEREARDRVGRMVWTGWAVMGLILVALAAIGLVVVRPASEVIRGQVQELERARNELEQRVRERTRELQVAADRHQALIEQFSHVARTTVIGEMASGLAHELKQPLGAIANYAEGCLVELSSPQPAIHDVSIALERLLAATMRTGNIIERIRQFVTRQEPCHEPFAPNVIVEEVQAIFRDEVGQRTITVVLDLAPDLPSVCGDAIQIQQVLINLVRNAFDAIGSAQPRDPRVLIQTKQAVNGGVEFSVTDNGEGIDPERLPKVFDAYFSTRAGGMGMGLAISRTIVEAHQGRISYTSEPNVATTFRFTLPPWSG